MPRFLTIVSVAFALLVLNACTSSYEQVTQPASEQAFLHLTGNFMGTVLIINSQDPITLREGKTRTFQLEGQRFAAFEVAPGSLHVQIYRNDRVLINRELYVSNGNAVAIRVP